MIKSYQLIIIGRVQGVFYRASMVEMANVFGVVGFVMNKEDGSVYAEIEGETEALNKMIDWCNKGPSGAKVEEVKMIEQQAKLFEEFAIWRG
ncbi:MAG: acylphosphatase [Cyclobacteriaceae bacterium]